MFNRITIIGLGLIGGSIAMAIKNNVASSVIVAYDKNRTALKHALKKQVIDIAADNLYEAVKDSQLVIIGTPLSTYAEIIDQIKDHIHSDTIVMDVGSVKSFVAHMTLHLHQAFIPCHPIAGKAVAGFTASDKTLFQQKQVILTPPAQHPHPLYQAAIEQITQFWQTLGAYVSMMDANRHDTIYARTSHMPQALIYCESKAYKDLQLTPDKILSKHLRLQTSEATIWSDIFIYNKKYLLPLLEFSMERLNNLTPDDILLARRSRLSIPTDATKRVLPPEQTTLPYVVATLLTELAREHFTCIGSGFLDSTVCLTAKRMSPTVTLCPEEINALHNHLGILSELIAAGDSLELCNYLQLR